MDLKAVKTAYSQMVWGTLFLLVSININFIIYGISTRMIGLILFALALSTLKMKGDIPEFGRAGMLCCAGMCWWLIQILLTNLAVDHYFLNAIMLDLLNNGLWFIFMLLVYSNVLAGSRKLIPDSKKIERWEAWLPVIIMALAILGFASSFAELSLMIILLGCEILVAIVLMAILYEIRGFFVSPEEAAK